MKRWPSHEEIESALNNLPPEMVNDLADEAFDILTHPQLVAILASAILRRPRVIRTTVDDTVSMRDRF
jgi:hypothetical protein